MKSFVFLFAVFFSLSAQAKSVSVGGTIARELIELGKKIHIYDGVYGRDYIEATSIVCTKTVSDSDAEIRCQMIGNGETPQMVSISSKDPENSESAGKLRRILMEGTQIDRKINRTTKLLTVTSLVCSGVRLEHELDSLESEPEAGCTIEF
jgi:hypothetical protein